MTNKNNLEILIKFWDEFRNPLSFEYISLDYQYDYFWKCKKCGFEWQDTLSNMNSSPNCPCCESINENWTIYELRNVKQLDIFYDYEKNSLDIGFDLLKRWYYCPCCKGSFQLEYPLKEFTFDKESNLVHKISKCKNLYTHNNFDRNNSVASYYDVLNDIYAEEANITLLSEITFNSNHTKSYFWKCRDCMTIQLFSVREIIKLLNNKSLFCQLDKSDNFLLKSKPYDITCSTCFEKYDISEYTTCPYCSFITRRL